MTLSLIFKYILFVIVSFFTACNYSEESSDQKQTEISSIYSNQNKTDHEWIGVLNGLGFDGQIKDRILFITSSSQCGSCLHELSLWNESVERGNIDIDKTLLVVIEKFENRYRNFLETNDFVFPAFRDSAAVLINEDFITSLPRKIYFDKNATPMTVHPLGGDENIDKFLSILDLPSNHLLMKIN